MSCPASSKCVAKESESSKSRRAFLGPDAYVFGKATTGAYVASLKSVWGTLRLLASGIQPRQVGSAKRVSNRKTPAKIDLYWHDLRHEASSRLARRWCSRSRAAAARRTRQHHDDPALHERARELAGRVDAPGARPTSHASRAPRGSKHPDWGGNAERAGLARYRLSANCQPTTFATSSSPAAGERGPRRRSRCGQVPLDRPR
jgi:hypothetical protein